MEPAISVMEVHKVVEQTNAEAASIEEFIRGYPPLTLPPIQISPKGRDLGPMYIVTAQGRHAINLTPGGEVDRKLQALVERIQNKRRAGKGR